MQYPGTVIWDSEWNMIRIFEMTVFTVGVVSIVMVGSVVVGQQIKRQEAARTLEACRAAPSPSVGQECK